MATKTNKQPNSPPDVRQMITFLPFVRLLCLSDGFQGEEQTDKEFRTRGCCRLSLFLGKTPLLQKYFQTNSQENAYSLMWYPRPNKNHICFIFKFIASLVTNRKLGFILLAVNMRHYLIIFLLTAVLCRNVVVSYQNMTTQFTRWLPKLTNTVV